MLYGALGLQTLHREKFTIKEIWERTSVFPFKTTAGPAGGLVGRESVSHAEAAGPVPGQGAQGGAQGGTQ